MTTLFPYFSALVFMISLILLSSVFRKLRSSVSGAELHYHAFKVGLFMSLIHTMNFGLSLSADLSESVKIGLGAIAAGFFTFTWLTRLSWQRAVKPVDESGEIS